LNEYKNEIKMFGLLMKSPELFIDTNNHNNDNDNKENSVNYNTRDNGKSDRGKNLNLKADLTAEKTIEELKKAKQDKLYSKFGESFKT